MRCFALVLVVLISPVLPAADPQPAPKRSAELAFAALAGRLPARNIGPANMGGRIVDVVGVESDPKTWYVASANGGVWKTTDSGATMKPLFDAQDTLCIGSVAVCQAKPDVVYVGTGEGNPRNSVSWGKGVYKSVDGGATWTHVGLKDTQHIGRVAVHPTNPDIAYVAALGHVWAANEDRGLFKTTDGGKTWQKSHYLDADTGFVDVQIDPSDPNTVYAAAYPCRRDEYSGGPPKVQYGPHGGLYKTADGGKTWAKMGGGLPRRATGRCGLAIYRKNPNVVFAVVQTDLTDDLVGNAGQRAADNDADVKKGGIFRSDDKGKTWTKINDIVPRPFYYGQIRIDPTDDKRLYVLGVSLSQSTDGGATFTVIGRGTHADHHAMWINPADPKMVVLGNDGGLYVSKDRAQNFEAVRGMAIGQFYGVAVDMGTPYKVYGGLQDNGSWGGPSATDKTAGITLADWRKIGQGDGFQAAVDPTDPNTVYIESQYGALQRVNPGLGGGRGGGQSIRPGGRGGRGTAGGGAPAERFNWNSPILLSPHDSKTLYYGGQHLFRTTDRGANWEPLGPDLTRGTPGERSTGHTITAIAESPKKKGLLYVGVDDGKLSVSPDGGKTWTDVSDKIPGVPAARWINRIECSPIDEGTAFVTITRYRNDDLKPYVFKTTDAGKTWTSVSGNLPAESPVHVVRQSSRNPNLLFAGTEHGLYATVDGGAKWLHLTAGLPHAVTIHDLVIHPRDRDLVIGTHARSVYVMDAGPLEEMTAEVVGAEAHLFAVKPALPTTLRAVEANPKEFAGANPPAGAVIHFLASGPAVLTITDKAGKEIARWSRAPAEGYDTVVWDLKTPGETKSFVPAGEYTATLTCGNTTKVQKMTVVAAKAAK